MLQNCFPTLHRMLLSYTCSSLLGKLQKWMQALPVHLAVAWNAWLILESHFKVDTAQKMKFSIKDFFSKCDQIRIFSIFPFFPHFFRIFSFEDVHMSLLTSFFTLVLVSSLLMFLIGWMSFIALLLNVPKCYEDADPSSYLLTLLYLLSVFFCKTISTPPLLLGLPRLLSLLLCGSNS